MRFKREELLEYSRTILDIERQSRVMYEDCLGKIEDKEIRKVLKEILRDEIDHIKLAEKLLQILE